MKKIVLTWMLLLVSQVLLAKLAYLPLIEQDGFYPSSKSIIAYDLESNRLIKEIPIPGNMGRGQTPVYLDSTEQYFYVPYAANAEFNVARINTTTLTVDKQWENLSTPVDKILISPNDAKLYFINLNTGTGSNSLYEIDLLTDQISEAVNYPGSSIRQFITSDDGTHFILEIFDNSTSERLFITYETDDLSIKHTISIDAYTRIDLIDNPGENFYYTDSASDEFISRNLSNGTINWTFSSTNETFYFSPYERNPSTLVVSGVKNTYEIDKQTGIGMPLFAADSNLQLRGSFGRIEQERFVKIEHPFIVCITGFCSLSSFLEISITDMNAGTSTNRYISPNFAGSIPVGKFIGENFYRGSGEPTAVHILNQWWLLFSFGLLMAWIALRQYRKLGLAHQ